MAQHHILANDGLAGSAREALEKAGHTVYTRKIEPENLADFINDKNIDVLIVRSATKVRKDLLDKVKPLKMIIRAGVGLDNIDVDYAKQKGILVRNTPAASSHSVAELVMAHLLCGVRFLHDANREMPLRGDTAFKELKKKYSKGREVKGKTLGIIGFGRIGREVAKMAIGLEMKVLAHDPYIKEADLTLHFFDGQTATFHIQTVSKEEVLRNADFITLHVPAQDKPVIGEEEINMMKDGAAIINAARGGVVDEVALYKALEKGKLSFAALDVFADEPTPPVQLLMYPKLSLSPHIGASTVEAQERIGEEIVGIVQNMDN
ncbi:MAG: 3-phosphoglycerate dehydrogenase [Chlorobi bacterium]|nr:3-phosphoglycerate dehydrogenase [Chlorobiota bacterium]